MTSDTDTVPVVDENVQATVANVSPQGYSTEGQTTVAAIFGREIVPSDKNLPVVTSEGVKMTMEEAEKVVAESNGRAFMVADKEDSSMAGDFYNADNVVVGHAMLMLTPWVKGAVVPMIDDDTPLFAPADTGWGAEWLSVGATNEGFKVNVETSTTQITIEEQSTPVGETVESKAIGIEAVLAEATLQSIEYSWGGGTITTVAEGAGTAGTEKMSLSDDIEYFTGILETRNYNGFARRLYVPKGSITGSGEVAFRRAADKQMFPVRFASLCKPSEIQIVDITGLGT